MSYVRVQEKLVERQEAERKRVCYVGMTRSKDLLLLSGAVASRSAGDTVLDWLQDIGEGEIGNPMTGAWRGWFQQNSIEWSTPLNVNQHGVHSPRMEQCRHCIPRRSPNCGTNAPLAAGRFRVSLGA